MGGDYVCSGTGDYGWIKKFFKTSMTEIYTHRTIRLNGRASYNNNIFGFYDSNGKLILTISIDKSSFKIEVHLGAYNGTLLATGTTTFQSDITYRIEIYYKPLNSSGNIIIKVDGIEEINYTGDTTYGLENILGFIIGGANEWRQACDDIIIDDSDWVGKGHTFVGCVITGAGSSAQWTSSTGATNYANVDETPYSDTDYNSTNTTDALDLYSINDCLNGLDVTSVSGVYLNIRTAHEGAPTTKGTKCAIKSGTTTGTSSTVSQSLSFLSEQKIFEINPDTAAAFATADFTSGIEIGYKAVG
jgi:hypothetical protein